MIPKSKNKMKIVLISILVLVILLTCLGGVVYSGIKTMRRSHLRADARAAFAAEDWKTAEKLLSEYVGKDPDSEEDYVRLAQVYRHFGDTDEEMRCWYRASMLNPLKPEYWDTYIGCAMTARNFHHLYSSLRRKVFLSEELAPKDRLLYLISAVMTGRPKDAKQYYERMLKEDSEAFQRDDFGRYVKFLVTINKITENERSEFIEQGTPSDDSFVRLESILFYLGDLVSSGKDADTIDEQMETMLKQAVDLNRFAGTPYLAHYYFSRLRFSSVIELLEPYLENIKNLSMAVLYAESCVYGAQPEKLKPLAEKYRHLGEEHRLLASYFDALYIFSQSAEEKDKLAKLMQEAGGVVQSPLTNLINLQIALNNDSVEGIISSIETIMKNPPFYDLQERARSTIHRYLWNKIQEKPALADHPRMIKLAQLISSPDKKDPFLMRIVLSDLRRRNMLTRQIILENLAAFPNDPCLLQMAAEFELFHDNPEQCLEYAEQFYALKGEKPSAAFDLLHMLALELMGKIDEAAKEYTAFAGKAEMNPDILYSYFEFCIKYERKAELSKMADCLNASTVPELKALAPFFQAEELFLQGKEEEALSLLETAKTNQTDFALYAATKFSSCRRVEQALSRYLALVDKHPDQRLILANIAEAYFAKGMKEEALSWAKRCWEMNYQDDDELSQFVYAQMLAANGRYQDAEKVLKISKRNNDMPDYVRKLWTDIMLHCTQEDLASRFYTRALERANRYLFFFPDDATFLEFKSRAEQELKKDIGS